MMTRRIDTLGHSGVRDRQDKMVALLLREPVGAGQGSVYCESAYVAKED